MIERVVGVCGGEPVISGTRITISHIKQLRDRLGWDAWKILTEYPQLTIDEVREALDYKPGGRHAR